MRVFREFQFRPRSILRRATGMFMVCDGMEVYHAQPFVTGDTAMNSGVPRIWNKDEASHDFGKSARLSILPVLRGFIGLRVHVSTDRCRESPCRPERRGDAHWQAAAD